LGRFVGKEVMQSIALLISANCSASTKVIEKGKESAKAMALLNVTAA